MSPTLLGIRKVGLCDSAASSGPTIVLVEGIDRLPVFAAVPIVDGRCAP